MKKTSRILLGIASYESQDPLDYSISMSDELVARIDWASCRECNVQFEKVMNAQLMLYQFFVVADMPYEVYVEYKLTQG